ncbi:MAG: hypothetical protein P1U72_20335, partial [Paracoccaceae bacterium]|nr:hypothetical protein [Paracoccaceae bacterium]
QTHLGTLMPSGGGHIIRALHGDRAVCAADFFAGNKIVVAAEIEPAEHFTHDDCSVPPQPLQLAFDFPERDLANVRLARLWRPVSTGLLGWTPVDMRHASLPVPGAITPQSLLRRSG